MAPRRRPKGVRGVQNEPKCVPEAFRRRPRASKKRPGGKKLDLVVFYRLFKRPQVTGRHQAGSRNNLPVREVNRTIIFTNTNSSAKSTAYGANPNTHWCARGHGADIYLSKVLAANLPLQALEEGLQERMYYFSGYVRHASGKYDLVDRECNFQ